MQFGIPGFSESWTIALNQIRFEMLGGIYKGRGLLGWKPERGFHVDAFLDRHGIPLPKKIEFGKVGVPKPAQLRQLRLSFNGGRALTSPIAVGEHWELCAENRLSADFASALFIGPNPIGSSPDKHYGLAVLNVGKGLLLPDSVERETKIDGKGIAWEGSKRAIKIDDRDIKLTAIIHENGCLNVYCTLSGGAWKARHAWNIGHAVAYALTFLGGRTVQLLERETYRRNRKYVERRICPDVDMLGYLAMAPRKTALPCLICKQQFIALTRFFLRGGNESEIARRMCQQMAEAARQQTRAAQELLCANVLDAALRTLVAGKPYNHDDGATKIPANMDSFRQKYLSAEVWKQPCKRALDAYNNLRHRNAHPDWLSISAGAVTDDAVTQSLDALIRLARFYGYMVLAMADFRDLEPEFPAPHKEWGPSLTYTRGDEA